MLRATRLFCLGKICGLGVGDGRQFDLPESSLAGTIQKNPCRSMTGRDFAYRRFRDSCRRSTSLPGTGFDVLKPFAGGNGIRTLVPQKHKAILLFNRSGSIPVSNPVPKAVFDRSLSKGPTVPINHFDICNLKHHHRQGVNSSPWTMARAWRPPSADSLGRVARKIRHGKLLGAFALRHRKRLGINALAYDFFVNHDL